jgi:hypothetical protein
MRHDLQKAFMTRQETQAWAERIHELEECVNQQEQRVAGQLQKHKDKIDQIVLKSIEAQFSTKMEHFEAVASSFRKFFNYEDLG